MSTDQASQQLKKQVGWYQAKEQAETKAQELDEVFDAVLELLETAGMADDAVILEGLRPAIHAGESISGAVVQQQSEQIQAIANRLQQKGKLLEASEVEQLALELANTAHKKLEGEQLGKQVQLDKNGQDAIELGKTLAESLKQDGQESHGGTVAAAVQKASAALSGDFDADQVNAALADVKATGLALSSAGKGSKGKKNSNAKGLLEGAKVMDEIADKLDVCLSSHQESEHLKKQADVLQPAAQEADRMRNATSPGSPTSRSNGPTAAEAAWASMKSLKSAMKSLSRSPKSPKSPTKELVTPSGNCVVSPKTELIMRGAHDGGYQEQSPKKYKPGDILAVTYLTQASEPGDSTLELAAYDDFFPNACVRIGIQGDDTCEEAIVKAINPLQFETSLLHYHGIFESVACIAMNTKLPKPEGEEDDADELQNDAVPIELDLAEEPTEDLAFADMLPAQQAAALAAMPAEQKTEALATLSPDGKAAVLAEMPAEEKALALDAMSPEDRATVMNEIPAEESAAAIIAMPSEQSANALSLMSPRRSTAALMSMSPDERAAAVKGLPPRERLAKKKAADLALMPSEQQAATIAAMPVEQQAAALATFAPDVAAAAIVAMSHEDRAQALYLLSAEEQSLVLAAMSPEDRATALGVMSAEESAEALAAMAPEDRTKALETMPEEEREAVQQVHYRALLRLVQSRIPPAACRAAPLAA